MKKLLIFISPLLLLFAAGCEPKVKSEVKIIVNHEAEACDIEDPIEHIEWLNELHTAYVDARERADDYKNNTSSTDIFYIFRNDTSGANSIVLQTVDSRYTGYAAYDCNGEEMFDAGVWNGNITDKEMSVSSQSQAQQVPPKGCKGCDEFFKHNTLVDTLAQYLYIVTNN